ncbi:MAG TPA: NB-ARC domain-containing protein, partial [Rhodospirillales bacterium]|nr:NB-ARC domain-containing protein [Rhodospirillales bacterium]
MTEQRPPRVFISYSHDSGAHAARVLKLANDLRRDGIDAIIDQYFTAPPPPANWHRWMDGHIRDDDFVIMVCTETYYRRVVGNEAPEVGKGVGWEGDLIYSHLFKTKSDLSRFVPVLLSGGRTDQIPEAVAGASHYFVEISEGYEGLLRRLFNRPAAEMPPIGERPALAVLPARWHEWPPANLHGVPELPPHFLPRPETLGELKQKLLATDSGTVGVTGVAIRVGVHGMGGIGKSVLAAALARDDEVRNAFPAGVFWVPLGQTPNLLTRQADLYRQLTGQSAAFADAQQGRVALQEKLRERVCLVVLDDVWRLADAEAFNVVDAEARLLLTTRDAAIVKGMGAGAHEVEQLDRAASLRLLAQTAGVGEADLPAEADAIAEECGDLLLALALAGGMIAGQSEMWGLVLDALRAADIEQIEGEFPGYPYPHVFAAIEASVDALGADRERYLDLAIFSEDVPIPEATLKTVWAAAGLGALKVRTLMNRLRDRSLAALDAQGRLSLHDLQRDFVRSRAADLPARHQRLLDAWRKLCRDGWASGPDDGYFFRHLPYHLAAAGREDELRDLLLDYRWIKAKLKATDVPALLADYA